MRRLLQTYYCLFLRAYTFSKVMLETRKHYIPIILNRNIDTIIFIWYTIDYSLNFYLSIFLSHDIYLILFYTIFL